jgi:WD40 repeat protein
MRGMDSFVAPIAAGLVEGGEMANTSDSDLTRSGHLRKVGGWLLAVLAILGTAAVMETALRADPDASMGGQERPFAQVARDDLHSPVWSLAFSPDGAKLALSTMAGDVWLMDDAHGLRTVIRHDQMNTVRSLTFSPDGRVLAIGGPGHVVRLVDASSASELEPLETDDGDNATYVAISPDGRYLDAGGPGGTITIWDTGSRRRLGTLNNHDGVTTLAFSPDGSTLAAGDVTGRVRLWAIPGGTERMTLAAYAPRYGVTALAFSPDGKYLATASRLDACVRLWDPSDGRVRGAIPRTSSNVVALAFSPCGTPLAVARADGSAVLWGIEEGREFARVRANGYGLRAVAFSADGRSFATGGADDCVRFWDLAQALGRR